MGGNGAGGGGERQAVVAPTGPVTIPMLLPKTPVALAKYVAAVGYVSRMQ